MQFWRLLVDYQQERVICDNYLKMHHFSLVTNETQDTFPKQWYATCSAEPVSVRQQVAFQSILYWKKQALNLQAESFKVGCCDLVVAYATYLHC